MKHYKHKLFLVLGLLLAIISFTLIILASIYWIIESSSKIESEISYPSKAFACWILSLLCLIPSLLLFLIDAVVSYQEYVNPKIGKFDLIFSISIICLIPIDGFVIKGDAQLIVLYICYALFVGFKCYTNFINKSSKIMIKQN